MFSISSVNKSKFETLQRTLKEAFSARVITGGESVLQAGADTRSKRIVEQERPTTHAASRAEARREDAAALTLADLRAENAEFARLKAKIDAYARGHGLSRRLQTRITRRGLRIRLLTDDVVFASGSAGLRSGALPLLDRVARLLRTEGGGRPIQVDGHTDDVPVRGGAFHDNWELSTARAASVVRRFIADGVPPRRLGAGGFAHLHPVASNAGADGRARNRRVEILLARRSVLPAADRP
jgi:chemotaxis protein MotB